MAPTLGATRENHPRHRSVKPGLDRTGLIELPVQLVHGQLFPEHGLGDAVARHVRDAQRGVIRVAVIATEGRFRALHQRLDRGDSIPVRPNAAPDRSRPPTPTPPLVALLMPGSETVWHTTLKPTSARLSPVKYTLTGLMARAVIIPVGSSNRTSASNSLQSSSKITSMRYRIIPLDWLYSSTARLPSPTTEVQATDSGFIVTAPLVPSARPSR